MPYCNSKSSFPKRVTLELTNRCNQKCGGCPRNKMRYPVGNMDVSLLEHIVGQLPEQTVVVPFFRGESALHPRFVDAMQKLQKFKTVQMATNGVKLNRLMRDSILKTCSFVSTSLHRFTLPTHEKNGFLHAAKTAGVTTQVSIIDSLVPPTQHDVFVKAWLKHADRVRIYREHSHKGFGDLIGRVSDNQRPCHKPFKELVVYWNGKLGLCNHDWNGPLLLGNLTCMSVEDAWDSVQYNLIRELHNEGDRTAVKPCEVCDYWKAGYLEAQMFGELHKN